MRLSRSSATVRRRCGCGCGAVAVAGVPASPSCSVAAVSDGGGGAGDGSDDADGALGDDAGDDAGERGSLLAAPHRTDGGFAGHFGGRTWCRRDVRHGGVRHGRGLIGTGWGAPPGRDARPGEGRCTGLRTLQDAHPLRQRLHARVEVRSHRAHGGDLEDDLRVGCLAHVDQRVPQDLHAAHHTGEAHRLGHRAEPLERRPGHRAQLGRQRGEEDLAEIIDQLCGELLRAPPAGQQRAERHQHLIDVTIGQGAEDSGEFGAGRVGRPGRDDLIQRRERVPGRPPASPHGSFERLLVDLEPRLLVDRLEQAVQCLRAQEPELEMLGPAPDGRWHLLRVRGRQHEDDVARWLLQRLQQGVGRRRRQHVDLVDDVHLPTSRRAQSGMGHEIAHGIDAVVGRRIELVDIEGAALGDLDARRADATGLAVDGRLAVERLGQNPRRGRLARPPRPAEEVGVRDPVVPNGAAQGAHHVVLASEFVEPTRPEAPVEGNERSVGHGGRAYPCAQTTPCARTTPPGARCGGQVGYGTRPYPLRAAAFRP